MEKKKERAITLEDFYYLGKIFPEVYKFSEEMVLKSQNPDGGFGFYPGTTSFMENTYYAVKILSVLGKLSAFPERLKYFIKLCHNSDGGFSRKPGGVSFPESTYQAIYILNLFED